MNTSTYGFETIVLQRSRRVQTLFRKAANLESKYGCYVGVCVMQKNAHGDICKVHMYNTDTPEMKSCLQNLNSVPIVEQLSYKEANSFVSKIGRPVFKPSKRTDLDFFPNSIFTPSTDDDSSTELDWPKELLPESP